MIKMTIVIIRNHAHDKMQAAHTVANSTMMMTILTMVMKRTKHASNRMQVILLQIFYKKKDMRGVFSFVTLHGNQLL